MHRPICAGLVAAACLVAGCASGGAVPRPFPGAPAPGTRPTPPAGEASPDVLPLVRLPVLDTALALRGSPYRAGGSDPTGFDCSGFVRYVFAQHGRRLPRETRDQFKEGAPVERSEVLPGDLVFFETVSRGASHVGIALGGDEFVHAPSSRGVVRVERYTADYWARRWVGARRIVDVAPARHAAR